MKQPHIMSATDIHLRYNDTPILQNITAHFPKGQITGLIGPNGAGKSCFMRILAGIEQPTSGQARFDNQSIHHMKPLQRARLLAYMPQHRHVEWPMSVYDLVKLGRIPYQDMFGHEENSQIVDDILERLDLSDIREKRSDQLSGGQLARVLLARTLAQTPQILLADEPNAALDPAYQLLILNCLKAAASNGMSIIIVLHDLSLAARYCDQIILMREGYIKATGTPDQTLTKSNLFDIYGVEPTITSTDSGKLFEFQ